MSSNRTPGKVLSDINGKPMLVRQIERLQKKFLNLPIVCITSNEKEDDLIQSTCEKNNFNFFRGSLNNVLERYIKAADYFNVDYIIRVGGDDPLIDPSACKAVINENIKSNSDFIYTSHRKGWPYGSACELISLNSLKKIQQATNEKLYLEHIIPWFYSNPKDFIIRKINAPKNILRPNYYFSVDYDEDIELIRTIFNKLEKYGEYFEFTDVINLCDKNPDLLNKNKHLHKGFDI